MRIVFLTHNFPPEVNAPAVRTWEHCVRWVRAGHEVVVVTPAPNWPHGVVYRGYRNRFGFCDQWVDGIRIRRVWTLLSPNSGVARRTASYLSFLASALVGAARLPQPDVVVATSPQLFCGWAGVLIAQLKRVPLVLEIRDLWPASISAVGAIRNSVVLRLLEGLERKMYRAAEHIVTVGPGYCREIRRRLEVPRPISIIPNGVDLRRFSPAASRRPGARGSGDGRFVCSYVGTIGMAHRLEVVLEAAARLQRMGRNDVHFQLVGDGANRKKLQQKAKTMGLGRMITFAGLQPRERIPAILENTDASLVHLRRHPLFETVIPSKLFEAMAMARPVIVGVSGDARRLVEDAQAGVAFEPESGESLAKAIQILADNPQLAGRLGQSGRKYVVNKFDREKLAEQFLALLEGVVRAHCSRCPRSVPVQHSVMRRPARQTVTVPLRPDKP